MIGETRFCMHRVRVMGLGRLLIGARSWFRTPLCRAYTIVACFQVSFDDSLQVVGVQVR
jgi:hypothetical protein